MRASTPAFRRRLTGVTIPLFALRTARSWGIGEIGDLPAFAAWIATAGVRLVQILPLGEISGSETSPYSALSAFGLDPLYISLADVPDLGDEAVREAVGGDVGMAALERARAADAVDYGAVRFLKGRALRFAYERFARTVTEDSERGQAFDAFVAHERAWLDDYALFRALKDHHGGIAWWDWPENLRDRNADALDAARRTLATDVRFQCYQQWVGHTQWDASRSALHEQGIEIMGDLPFMVGRDSADVWANQGEFRMDASVGVPGDQFNEEGQDWGLPPYRWDAMRANDFAWLRKRARYAGSLYDRFRIDHLVGFYRTFMRPSQTTDAEGHLVPGTFDPPEEHAQLAHGERVVGAMVDAARERNARLVAEDLGTVPPWVRENLTRLGVPGYKVLIWEKDENVFREPGTYPVLSVACFGTHDTDPVSVWWETRDEAERDGVKQLSGLRDRANELGNEFTPAVHRALLDLIHSAPSELVLLLMQDVLATRERVNTPATVGPQNWSYRLPRTIESLRDDDGVKQSLATVLESARGADRV